MEFTLRVKDLARELGVVRDAAEKQTTIPVLQCVLFTAVAGRVDLAATDLGLAIRCSCEAKVKREGAIAIPAARLYEWVKLLAAEEEIAVSVGEAGWVSLKCARSRVRMAGMERAVFPELPAMPAAQLTLPLKKFGTMLARTKCAVEKRDDTGKFLLAGVLVAVDGKGLVRVVSTDGHRLAFVSGACGVDAADVFHHIVPRKAMVEVLALAGETGDEGAQVQVAVDENHLFFEALGRTVIMRRMAGMFPDYERVLPAAREHQASMDREELLGAIRRVSEFADDITHKIRMQFAGGELRLFSEEEQTGSSEESLPAEYGGPEVEASFNARYLVDFLKASAEKRVSVSLLDAKSAGELRPSGESADEYRYVVMPMR